MQYIKAIEADYYDPTYLYGKSVRADASIQGRIPGCGTILLHFFLKGSQIEKVEVKGDYFALGEVGEAFENAFVGKEYTPATLVKAVEHEHPERTIRGLTAAALNDLIISECGA